MKKIKVYLWDNDFLMRHYDIGTYNINGYLIPFEMLEDISKESDKHNVFFSFDTILDVFLDIVLNGATSQAVSIDCSMFLQMVVVNGN